MSRFHASDYKADIASNKEIIFIFFVFATVLYFIYPSDNLKNQAMKEKSNYALSAIYLENMLQLDPKNEELLFAAIAADLGSGKVDLAKKLLLVLKESLDPKEQNKLHILQYKLYIIEEKGAKDDNESNLIKKKMQKLLHKASQPRQFREKNALIWYKYALELSQKEEALAFIKPLYEQGDMYALEQCIYLAGDLNRTQERLYCTEKLAYSDQNQSKRWLNLAYILYSESGNRKQAYEILKKLAKVDPTFLDELARIESLEQDYIEASKTFIFLSEHSLSKEKRDDYFLKAVQVLIDGDKIDKAAKLMKRYEDIYLEDKKMMNIYIQRYLAIGRLKEAQDLSIKLMKDGSYE